MDNKNVNRPGHYIFRAWITVNGERVYARDHGKRAFKIWVED